MNTEATGLPITDWLVADSADRVGEIVREAVRSHVPLYPIGGGTSLQYGMAARLPGWGVQLTGLHQVVDYPARDMTITVGAGITMQGLAELLRAEGQRLAIDAPCAHAATLGGLIACNHSGPLRFSQGTMRDHVIGIRAVDGNGNAYAGGGRVVKNVAGYDFCKLLTGSLGTLGVITEVTLKLKPIPPTHGLVYAAPADLAQLEELLAGLIDSSTTPAWIEFVQGRAWHAAPCDVSERGILAVGFEGTPAEVDWLVAKLQEEWNAHGVSSHVLRKVSGQESPSPYDDFYHELVEFAADESAPLILKIAVVPSALTSILQRLGEVDDVQGIQAHAGNGIVVVKFAAFPSQGFSNVLNSKLRPIAAAGHGSVTVLSNPSGDETTHHGVWGVADVPFDLMKRVKDAFDPSGTLNPGRFVY